MIPLATAAQIRSIDQTAIEERGIPSTLLMERAAKALVEEALSLPVLRGGRKPLGLPAANRCHASVQGEHTGARAKQQRSALVFCGPGNNGGDGVAAARLLLKAGWRVKCVLVGRREKMTGDCREMEGRLKEMGGLLEDFDPEDAGAYLGFDVAIDALFGVGLNTTLGADAAKAARLMKCAQWTLAADLPSGVVADTGQTHGAAVQADVTVTFSMGKPGLFVGKGAVHAGRVVIADIGIPQDLIHKTDCSTVLMDPPSLPRRRRDAHKGDFGRLFILAGSVGCTGAAALAARAAVRGGAGLVTLAVPQEIYPILAAKCDEAMVWPLVDGDERVLERAQGSHAVLIGPGLGRSAGVEELVLRLLKGLSCPVILDADGINAVSSHIDVLDKREGLTILTPHDGEFARLTGCDLPISDRLEAARGFARAHHCVLALKGYRTITAAWSGKCAVNPTGNPGMARGGSGDALAGLVAALLAQGRGPDGVAEAVWLHGRAGDLAAADKGEYGMTVGDLIEQIPYALKEVTEGKEP